MTLEDLRTLCTAPGWSVSRVAQAIGRDVSTVQWWLSGGPVDAGAKGWLARVLEVREDGPRVSIIVHAPPEADAPA